MAIPFSSRKEMSDYNALRTSEETDQEIEAHGEVEAPKHVRSWSTIQVLGFVLVSFIFSGLLGYEVGSHRQTHAARDFLSKILVTMKRN